MELSRSMKFAMMRAKAEATAINRSTDVGIEHVFLGILKLSEITAEDFAPTSRYKEQIDKDIKKVKSLFESKNIDTSETRAKLRQYLMFEEINVLDYETIMKHAEGDCLNKGYDEIFAMEVLEAIFLYPSKLISELIPKRNDMKIEEKEKEEKNEDEFSIEFLPKLVSKIKSMRTSLMDTVLGQNHVVHAFAEGMFSAEVLAASDEKRKRPRAIFVFAGPPGVGKTFLAEQASEFLDIPFKRFDMSSYSDHQAYMGLVGFEKSYKDAKPGTLTSFVKDNPHSILLFDEIEKAHESTIHLFLQILDAGRLTDRFLDQDIVFKDTIIIFTTNAGRSLYEGEAKQNAAMLPRKTIINALETEKNKRTGQTFFPDAICSRLATGYTMVFNHLKAHDLQKIVKKEFMRFCELFDKQYKIKVDADKLLYTTLLLSEGGKVDARTLRAQTELFFKNEIYNICRLWNVDKFKTVLEKVENIRFEVDDSDFDEQTKKLFFDENAPEVLVFADELTQNILQRNLNNFKLHTTQDSKDAFTIAGKNDIRLAILDLSVEKEEIDENEYDPNATLLGDFNSSNDYKGTMAWFDNAPISSSEMKYGIKLFKQLKEKLPDVPIYILEKDNFKIDAEMETSLIRAGARGKIYLQRDSVDIFKENLSEICNGLFLQQSAAELGSKRKVLYYETTPKYSNDGSEITIRIRNLSIKRALDADDSNEILMDVEKPNVRFSDVIGANDAKDELKFFIDFLKDPKQLAIQGIKPPKGVLLHGPPGTGKTLLAKAMAGESDVAFIPATASNFVTKYQGSGPEAIRKLFERARKYAPAIVFIDEIDAIGRERGGSNSAHGEEMALNALLTQMDGFSVDYKKPVFVLAATNFEVDKSKGGIGVLDAALSRRFDRKILVDLPNRQDRLDYLNMMFSKMANYKVSNTMIKRLASRSTGMSLANLASVMELANRMAVKQQKQLDDKMLDEAFELTKHGEKKNWGKEYLERVARHESGHAYMCYLSGNTPEYLTIVARGGHGGYMEHSNQESSPLQTREQLIHRIRTSLGGRACEIVYYGEKDGISTGASGDLESATKIAKAMICNYGMDEEFGMAVMSESQANSQKVIDRVNQMIDTEMKETVKILNQSKDKIDKLVEALLSKNKLTKRQMERILK